MQARGTCNPTRAHQSGTPSPGHLRRHTLAGGHLPGDLLSRGLRILSPLWMVLSNNSMFRVR
jgi:hypothetical protein